jgi:hypothetical protein
MRIAQLSFETTWQAGILMDHDVASGGARVDA